MKSLLKQNHICHLLLSLFLFFSLPGWSHESQSKYLNIIKVNNSWLAYDVNSWERQHQAYETMDVQIFMICIWNLASPKVSLYRFNSTFDPSNPDYIFGGSQWVAYRESFNILNVDLASNTSASFTAAFKKIFDKITADFPALHYGIKYAGHGFASGGMFENKISDEDTKLLLAYINGLIKGKIDFLDWNTNCNAGSFAIVSNEYKYSKYILGSDILRGGYNFDVDEYFKYGHEYNLHKFFQATKSIRSSLVDMINSEYNFWNSPVTKNYMIQDKVPQSISIYDSEKFEQLVNGVDLCNPNSIGDALQYIRMKFPSKEPAFNEFRFHYISNKSFFTWPVIANGFSIVEVPAPMIMADRDPTICKGDSVLLTSNYNGNNQWMKDGIVLGGMTTYKIKATQDGDYSVRSVINGCISSSSYTIHVTVHSIPSPTIHDIGDSALCRGERVLLTSDNANQWYRNDTAIIGYGLNEPSLLVSQSGIYTAHQIMYQCSSAISNAVKVAIYDYPSTPTISQEGYILESSSNSGNQWYLNGNLINGAVDKEYFPSMPGNYTVRVTSHNCSSLFSSSFAYTPSTEKVRLKWINFSPYNQPGQNPNNLSVIPEAQIIKLLDSVKPYTEGIRTFGTQYGLELVPALAKQRGLKVIVGIWLSKDTAANAVQIANGIAIAKAGYADRLIVGSEALLRGDLTPSQLIKYIQQVKQANPNIPVSTADVYNHFLTYPDVVQAVDFIAVNIYPFWEGVTVECAMMRFHEAYLSLLPLKGNKEIFISEAGWKTKGPIVGEAVPSLKNTIRYDHELLSWSKAYGIQVSLFSFIDEPWKSNNVNDDDGWGIFDNTVRLKTGMDTLFTPIIKIDTTWLCKKVNTIISSDALKIDYIPVIGSLDNINGHVDFLPACGYSIAAYIKVNGVWWTKPTFSTPTVPIQCNGKWSIDYTTGPGDQLATDICVFLVPSDYTPPKCQGCGAIHPEVSQKAFSSKCITRYDLQSASIMASKETICNGDTAILTAKGGTNYIWSTGETLASIKVIPTNTTTYNVTITDGIGGGSIVTKTITVNNTPTATISTTRINICPGDTTTLTASGGTNYKWSTGQTTALIKVSPKINTNYTVTVNNASECSDTASTTIYPDIIPTPVRAYPDTICSGSSTLLRAGLGMSYLWSDGGTSDSIKVSPLITTIYSVKVTTANGCTYSSQDTVVVLPLPALRVKAYPDNICQGDTVLLVAKGGPPYIWSDIGRTTDSVKLAPIQTTNYRVSVTSNSRCTSMASIIVQVANKPSLSISAVPDSIHPGEISTLKATSEVGNHYTWNTGDTTSTIQVSPKTTSYFTVTITSKDGCIRKDSIRVTMIATPTVAASNNINFKSIKIYPKPTHGLIWIELKLLSTKSLDILLLNEMGVVLNKRKQKTILGEIAFNFDLTLQPSGIYFLKLITENGYTWTEKVIKL